MTRYVIIKDCREGKAGQAGPIPGRRAEALIKSGHIRPYHWTEKAVQKNG